MVLSFSPVIYMLTTATDDSGRRYLSNIVVSSDHQGKGIGSGLLAVGTDAADKEGLPIFCLSSDEVSGIKKNQNACDTLFDWTDSGLGAILATRFRSNRMGGFWDV